MSCQAQPRGRRGGGRPSVVLPGGPPLVGGRTGLGGGRRAPSTSPPRCVRCGRHPGAGQHGREERDGRRHRRNRRRRPGEQTEDRQQDLGPEDRAGDRDARPACVSDEQHEERARHHDLDDSELREVRADQAPREDHAPERYSEHRPAAEPCAPVEQREAGDEVEEDASDRKPAAKLRAEAIGGRAERYRRPWCRRGEPLEEGERAVDDEEPAGDARAKRVRRGATRRAS
jgi:hypothetical protein